MRELDVNSSIATAFEAMVDVVDHDGQIDRAFETFITVVKMHRDAVCLDGHETPFVAVPNEAQYDALIALLEALRQHPTGL